jgi:replicative DNA helicase
MKNKTNKLDMNESLLKSLSNEEAEHTILGCIILRNEAMSEVYDLLDPKDFYYTQTRDVYSACCDLYLKDEPINIVSLGHRLEEKGKGIRAPDKAFYAMCDMLVYSSFNILQFAKIVKDLSSRRRTVSLSSKILNQALNMEESIETTIDLSQQTLLDIGSAKIIHPFIDIPEAVITLGDAIEQIINGKMTVGNPTYMQDVDKLVGGFPSGSLIVIAARPSIGKTALMVNLVKNYMIRNNKSVLIFSLEQKGIELLHRLFALHAGVCAFDITNGRSSPNDIEKYIRASHELSRIPLFINDTPSIGVNQIRAMARRMKSKYNETTMLWVDYLQQVTIKLPMNRNREQEVAEICKVLKAIAKELDISVIVLAQLSRYIEQRGGGKRLARPILADLRESGQIEQEADIVMFIHRQRPEQAGGVADEKGQLIPYEPSHGIETELIIAKNRNGPTGSASVLFFPKTNRFTDRFVGLEC